MKKPELLAPAGGFKQLTAAVKAGCDAVYLGLQEFNMRQTGTNFKLSDLKKVREICNSGLYKKNKKVKIYLTLNTIIYDSEISSLEKVIKKIKGKVDAVICWDMSVIQLCRKNNIPFHISTQASVSNSQTARFYKKLGAERIILARELSLSQIKKIRKVIPVELFIHGAMCVSISGRCFTSQFQHNKSANRGLCMHPCRRFYNVEDSEGNKLRVQNNRIFSAKDLCTLNFIEKIKNLNPVSLKIEGRNREPEYVYTVVSAYRKAIDKKLTKTEKESLISELKKVYNKGFSSGFYLGIPTQDDFSSKEHSSSTQTKKFIGKVFHYWKKPGVAGVYLNSGSLKLGDEIIITGKTTFFKTIIKTMEISNKKISKVKKGQKVGIKLPECRKNDELYIVIKKNKNT
jgi:putative protease